jgi:hypothetical protein
MDERQLARSIAIGRVIFGAAMVIAPSFTGERWMGEGGTHPATRIAMRALGIRDVVLGAGAYRAMQVGEPVGPWVKAGGVADAVDATATALALRHIGPARGLPVMALATTISALSFRIADRVD